jgi:signal transduction histidine kinase
MGFDANGAVDFFQESIREWVLLDTGVVAESARQLTELANAIELPATRVAVGVDYTRLMLARLVAEWRLEMEQQHRRLDSLQQARERADDASAMDFLAQLASLRDEQAAIAAIAEMFRMLFAPDEFHYLRFEQGVAQVDDTLSAELLQEINALHSDWAWTRSGTGFLLRIVRGDVPLGVVVVERLAFPGFRERYLNLALSIVGVCGLAIENARTYQQIREAEARLRRYQDHLEEEVQLRTRDLVSARDAAQAANQAKSVFLANMSHELRTPLNAIIGFSEMLRKDAQLQDDKRQKLDIIKNSGDHLLALINDVLQMATIESTRDDVVEAPVDVGRVVRDVADMFQVRALEKGLLLEARQSSALPHYIVGDEARLRQMLASLIGNAIKFTQQGRVTVRVGASGQPAPRLVIEVEDTGPGIAQADQQRIFEPFVQLGEHGVNLGSGLGLTIARQFAQSAGGNIGLESTPGKGSVFRVELPLREAQHPGTAAPGDMAESAPPGPSDARQEPAVQLTSTMLAGLPDGLRDDLEHALESLVGERIARVIERVAPYDQTVQKLLTELAANFDYPAILKALHGN